MLNSSPIVSLDFGPCEEHELPAIRSAGLAWCSAGAQFYRLDVLPRQDDRPYIHFGIGADGTLCVQRLSILNDQAHSTVTKALDATIVD
jgi:hypothetical protein